MANPSNLYSLSPLSESSSPEDEGRLQSPTIGRQHARAGRVDDPLTRGLFTPSASRRRRSFGRFFSPADRQRADADHASSASRTVASSSGQAHFNPEAAEFVPGTKTPSKRKASSSARPDSPIIRGEDLFYKDSLSRSSNMAFEQADDLDADSELFDMEMEEELNLVTARPDLLRGPRERLEDVVSLLRSKITKTTDKVQREIQCTSALIYSYDSTSSVSGDSTRSSRLRYLPLQAVAGRGDTLNIFSSLTIVPSHRERIDETSLSLTATKAIWPHDELPVEIFDLITMFLSRDDVKSMRLVNNEFEKKVSRTLFNTSVVPFNTELYDMIEEDTKVVSRVARAHSRGKGKGKLRARDLQDKAEGVPGGLHWQNAKEDAEGKVYKGHGLRVFQGFGPHIRKFGMSFEVVEEQLARTVPKKELDHVDSYFGSYDWPHHQYTRFAGLAGLERTADDTMRMKSAFSNLRKVQDLALSLDSGLGWLDGPDKSIRAQVFGRPSPIFGSSWDVPDRRTQESRDFWQALNSSFRSLNFRHGRMPNMMLNSMPLSKPPSEIPGLSGTRYANPQFWSSLGVDKVLPTNGTEPNFEEMKYGILYTSFNTPDLASSPPYDKSALVPSDLRKEQKEWLLETEWAQRAFLECYILAIMDNPTIFGKVKTLNLVKISSGFLPLLARPTFWDALPGISDVTLLVKPDWRSVERDNAGFAEVCNQNPSEAVKLFHRVILRDRLCLRSSITKLNLGWEGGGEHAEGIFSRNANILPAPITPLESCDSRIASGGLIFQFVEHLTLTNCWLTPLTIEELITNHSGKAMKTLTLNSVSLTAHPRFPANGQAAPQLQVLPPPALGIGQVQQAAPLVNFANQNQNGQAHWVQQWFNLAGHNQNGQAQPPPQAHQFPLNQVQNIPMPPAGWAMQHGFANGAQFNGGHPQQAIQAQQQMLQQFIANNQNAGLAAPPPAPAALAALAAAAAPNNNNTNTQSNQVSFSHWSEGHREGSWPELLNKISPGTIFTDYIPPPAPWEEQLPPRPRTNLQTIELKSCGYVKLVNNTSFDQTAVLPTGFEAGLPTSFRERHAALAPAMMTTSDRYMARIVQQMPRRELNALLFAWGMTTGWADVAKAEETEFDGMAPGGTGRFSGTIDRGMALMDMAASSTT